MQRISALILALALGACTPAAQPVAPDAGPPAPALPPDAERACYQGTTVDVCTKALVPDPTEAKAAFERATAACTGAGSATPPQAGACVFLAVAHYNGVGTEKNTIFSTGFYQKACTLDHPGACTMLALKYKTGEDLPADENKYIDLISKACKLNDPDACFFFAGDLIQGDGESFALGVQLLKKACTLKHPKACETAAKADAIMAAPAAEAPSPPEAAQASEDQTLTAYGVRWTVEADLTADFKLKKVTCQQPFRNHVMCELTVALPNGWPDRQLPPEGRVLDGDGAQTAVWRIGNMMDAEPGRVLRDRFRIDTDTRSVIFRR